MSMEMKGLLYVLWWMAYGVLMFVLGARYGRADAGVKFLEMLKSISEKQWGDQYSVLVIRMKIHILEKFEEASKSWKMWRIGW